MTVTYWFCGGMLLFLLYFLTWSCRRGRRRRVEKGMCVWCNVYVAQEDREGRYQTSGGQVMCPICWEFTRVKEAVSHEKWKILRMAVLKNYCCEKFLRVAKTLDRGQRNEIT